MQNTESVVSDERFLDGRTLDPTDKAMFPLQCLNLRRLAEICELRTHLRCVTSSTLTHHTLKHTHTHTHSLNTIAVHTVGVHIRVDETI